MTSINITFLFHEIKARMLKVKKVGLIQTQMNSIDKLEKYRKTEPDKIEVCILA